MGGEEGVENGFKETETEPAVQRLVLQQMIQSVERERERERERESGSSHPGGGPNQPCHSLSGSPGAKQSAQVVRDCPYQFGSGKHRPQPSHPLPSPLFLLPHKPRPLPVAMVRSHPTWPDGVSKSEEQEITEGERKWRLNVCTGSS